MEKVYYIFLISFLAYPILTIVISQFLKINWSSKFTLAIIGFFVLHNFLFLIGYSLKGDYIDYIILSIEYFFFCLAVFDFTKLHDKRVKLIRIICLVTISCGFIFGAFGILFFIFLSMDYESDHIFHFENDGKTYETRRYSFGGATLSSTKYTFETYREFVLLPIEHKIDVTIFFDTQSNLDISDLGLKINVISNQQSRQIVFSDSTGKTFKKHLNQ